MDIFVFYVPDTILSQIFANYLSLDDVSRFDIAICDRNKRPQFLDCLKSDHCVWFGSKDEDFGSDKITWLRRRSMKIRHLICNRISKNRALAKTISGFGSSLSWLSIQDGRISNKKIAKIVYGCRNLQYLNLSNCDKITDISIRKVGRALANLQELTLSQCDKITDVGIIKIAEGCHSLRDLILRNCYSITDSSIIRIAEGCPNLQCLTLNGDKITDACIISIAEGCLNLHSLSLTCFGNTDSITDSSIMRIAEKCRNLVDLGNQIKYLFTITYFLNNGIIINNSLNYSDNNTGNNPFNFYDY
jgi:hypothetical protein